MNLTIVGSFLKTIFSTILLGIRYSEMMGICCLIIVQNKVVVMTMHFLCYFIPASNLLLKGGIKDIGESAICFLAV